MRVLQLMYESRFSPFGFGGAGVRAYEIYSRLRKRHDITLLCMKYPGAVDGEINGLRHVFVGTESSSLYRSVIAFTVGVASYLRRMGKQYDVIVENFLPATPFLARFQTRAPVILQIQGIMGKHAIKKFGLFPGVPMYLVEKIYPRLYSDYILVTDEDMENLTERASRYYVIPNGVDPPEAFAESPAGDYILFMSRIDIYTKGLDLLVEAFADIAGKYPGLRLILAGFEFDKVEALIAGIPEPVRKRIEYRGFLEGNEKWALLRGTQVFVLPSRHEAHPVSLLEALAAGTPVLVSDIPQMKYVEDLDLGLTFRRGSPEDLRRKLCHLLDNENLRREFGRKGKKYAGEFSWDRIASRFEDALNEVADG